MAEIEENTIGVIERFALIQKTSLIRTKLLE